MLQFFQSSTNEHLVHEEESKQKNLKSSIKKPQTLLTATTLETVSNVLTLQKRVAVGRNLLKSIYSQSRKCQVLRRKTAQVLTLLKKKV
jgi:diphthamide synthase subunit DPH2